MTELGLELGLSAPTPPTPQCCHVGTAPYSLPILCVHCAVFILHLVSALRKITAEPILQMRKGRLGQAQGLAHLAGPRGGWGGASGQASFLPTHPAGREEMGHVPAGARAAFWAAAKSPLSPLEGPL